MEREEPKLTGIFCSVVLYLSLDLIQFNIFVRLYYICSRRICVLLFYTMPSSTCVTASIPLKVAGVLRCNNVRDLTSPLISEQTQRPRLQNSAPIYFSLIRASSYADTCIHSELQTYAYLIAEPTHFSCPSSFQPTIVNNCYSNNSTIYKQKPRMTCRKTNHPYTHNAS